jgi:AmiR/NasT family two-component response regulator
MLLWQHVRCSDTCTERSLFMSFVLLISRDVDCRKLYVDNLIRRGYIVVGVASAGEAERLLHNVTPDLVLVCCMPTTYPRDIEELRTTYRLTSTPILLVNRDSPDPAWTARWNVTVRADDPADSRQLVEMLGPWLPAMQSRR